MRSETITGETQNIAGSMATREVRDLATISKYLGWTPALEAALVQNRSADEIIEERRQALDRPDFDHWLVGQDRELNTVSPSAYGALWGQPSSIIVELMQGGSLPTVYWNGRERGHLPLWYVLAQGYSLAAIQDAREVIRPGSPLHGSHILEHWDHYVSKRPSLLPDGWSF